MPYPYDNGNPPNPYTYNPMQAYQAHMQNISQQPMPPSVQQMTQPPMPQQPMPQPVQQYQVPSLKGRPVTGADEARAAQIDFDGSVHVFTDIPNGKIYTKQLGLNGAAVFNTYVFKPPEMPAAPENPERVSILEQRITELENQIKELVHDVQSNATDRNASKQRKPNGDSATDSGK